MIIRDRVVKHGEECCCCCEAGSGYILLSPSSSSLTEISSPPFSLTSSPSTVGISPNNKSIWVQWVDG